MTPTNAELADRIKALAAEVVRSREALERARRELRNGSDELMSVIAAMAHIDDATEGQAHDD